MINVLDTESKIANAPINFASAFLDVQTAVYQLLLAMGHLNKAELINATLQQRR